MSTRLPALLVLLAGALASADETRKVGIYPLERLGPADPAYDRLEESLRRNVGALPHVESFALATPRRCKADDLRCLVGVGQLAAADVVVHGSVERFADGYAVRLQLIDVTKTTRREVKRLVQGSAEDLAAAMEGAACELVVTGRCEGTLRVAGPPGARLLVAARDVGGLPWSGALPVGRHAVRVARSGLSTDDRFVNVSYGQEAVLDVTEKAGLLAFSDAAGFGEAPLLPPELVDEMAAAAPPIPAPEVAAAPTLPPAVVQPPAASATTWMEPAMYTTVGIGGALLATGALFGVLSEVTAAEANERFDSRTLVASDKALYETARSRARTANVLFGVGATSVAIGALLFVAMPVDTGAGGEVRIAAGPDGVIAAGSF